MPHFIVLGNFTDDGARKIRALPKHRKAIDVKSQIVGVNVQRFFTLGHYDLVFLVEAINDEAMARWSIALSEEGYIRSTTLRAFGDKTFFELIEHLPDLE